MNKTKKILTVIAFILVTAVCATGVTIAVLADANRISINSDGVLSAEEAVKLTNKLEKKNFSQLIKETDKLDINKDGDIFGCYYDAVKSKLHDVSKNDITSELLSKKISDDTKINLLLLCETEEVEINYDDLLPILEDKSVSSGVKGVLVDLLAGEDETYADEIAKYASTCGESELTRALLALKDVRPEQAEKKANNILSDMSGSFSPAHKAAIIVKSALLESNSTDDEIDSFINVCDRILKSMPADDVDDKEVSVIYALSALKSKKSFSYLMNLDMENAVDFRAYIVDENEDVIDGILNSSPDFESVDLIAKTYAYYVPQAQFKEKTEKYLNDNGGYFSENADQKEMLLEVIK